MQRLALSGRVVFGRTPCRAAGNFLPSLQLGLRCTSTTTAPSSAANGGDTAATIAPKRTRPKGSPAATMASSAVPSAGDVRLNPTADAQFSTDGLAEKLDELARLDPAQLDALIAKLSAQEEHEGRVLASDGVHQMDVSLKMRFQGGQRVFWKDVDVVPLAHPTASSSSPVSSATAPLWYGISIDGRKAKAFETKSQLVVPSEEFAYAIAHEFAQQTGTLNKLTMPLSDIASGAQHVTQQAILPRLDYVMSFFKNDNLFFRQEPIADKQDKLADPITRWFERVFDVVTPRIVGLGHPRISPADLNVVRDGLIRMDLNQYQVVALCVIAQHTASLMLALALVNKVVTIEHGLALNRAEEGHNIDKEGQIAGYHDIREADVVVKIAASVLAWQFTKDVSVSQCADMIGAAAADDALEAE